MTTNLMSASGALRRWPIVVLMACVAVAFLSSPSVHWQIQRARARAYCDRINAQLPSDPRFRDVRASQPMKGPFLFTLDGSVRTQEDFDALVHWVEATKPLQPYNPKGVFVLPDTQ
jgi:hypothetical protein